MLSFLPVEEKILVAEYDAAELDRLNPDQADIDHEAQQMLSDEVRPSTHNARLLKCQTIMIHQLNMKKNGRRYDVIMMATYGTLSSDQQGRRESAQRLALLIRWIRGEPRR